MLLSLFNHLSRGDQEVRQGLWLREKNRGIELKGKTVGLIGFGFMGQALAQRLQGFGVTILAHDKYKTGFGSDSVKEVTLAELQEKSDVISIHLPYTEETHYYIDEQFIANCKKPFYLINTARGKCLDTSALVKGINAQKVLGACLDVSEFESLSFENLNKEELPQAFQDLIASEKVILSPHVAGWTVESYEKLSSFLAEKISFNC
jgi:D-3-phosphoglycerate dehydrogenase